MTEPRTDHERLGVRAWTLLQRAREMKEKAATSRNHVEAESMLWFRDEYVRMARKANHQSIQRRPPVYGWKPPCTRR